ncbi:MAG: BON domain-containing protein [Verrucomicrobiota bacterium]
MKKILILGAAALALVACNKQEQAEKNQIEQEKEAQKSALNQEKKDVNAAANEAKDQVTDQAKAEKKQIEAEADAQKSVIDAQKKLVDEQADAAKANVKDATDTAKTDLRGLNPGFRGENSLSVTDRTLTETLQKTWADNVDYKNVTFSTMEGKVTLNGTVHTEQAKDNIEKAVKKMPSVKSVNNKIEVTP